MLRSKIVSTIAAAGLLCAATSAYATPCDDAQAAWNNYTGARDWYDQYAAEVPDLKYEAFDVWWDCNRKAEDENNINKIRDCEFAYWARLDEIDSTMYGYLNDPDMAYGLYQNAYSYALGFGPCTIID